MTLLITRITVNKVTRFLEQLGKMNNCPMEEEITKFIGKITKKRKSRQTNEK